MNKLHPLQTPLWGEFRRKTGVTVIDVEGLLMTLHSIPHTKYKIGYLPKSLLPTKQTIDKLLEIGKKENCIFIQLEPDVEASENFRISNLGLKPSAHPLLTKYNFVLDLTKSEDDILKNMHPKTRYNIKLAQKKGVRVVGDNSDEAFKKYLRLRKETTQRQNYYAHSEAYHKLMWETLRQAQGKHINTDILTAHLLKATYKGETLVAWILFILGDTLYYPYGASTNKYREVMASNLMMFEAIKFGKSLGLKNFDMWGALGLNPNPKDPFYGFHKFKMGYGPKFVEYVGSFDLVINKKVYLLYKVLDKLRWAYLKIR